VGFFGGGGGGGFTTEITTPPQPQIPNSNLLNSAAQRRIEAASPWYTSPWRSIDFFQGMQVPQNQIPQYQPGAMPQYPVGGLGFMGNFNQPPVGPQNLGWLAPFLSLLSQIPQGVGLSPTQPFAGPLPPMGQPQQGQPQQGQPSPWKQSNDKSPIVTAPGAPDNPTPKPRREHEGRVT
jgi:hypothetical protein